MSKVNINLKGILAPGNTEYKNAWRRGMFSAGKLMEELAAELAPYDPESEYKKHLNEDGKTEFIGSDTVRVSFGDDLENARAVWQEFGYENEYGEFIEAQSYLGIAEKEIDVLTEIAAELKRVLG